MHVVSKSKRQLSIGEAPVSNSLRSRHQSLVASRLDSSRIFLLLTHMPSGRSVKQHTYRRGKKILPAGGGWAMQEAGGSALREALAGCSQVRTI